MHDLLTIVIPVRNEAANLRRCLPVVTGLGRVMVVDSGSTDNTAAISRELGAEVVNFQWNGTFPKKRNWVLRNIPITSSWILFLDADEVPTEAFIAEMTATLPATTHHGFMLRYENMFMGKKLRHGDTFRKLALFRVGSGEYEKIEESFWSALDMEIHEHPVISGTVGEISAPLLHEDDRGLHHYISKHNQYADWEVHRWFTLHALPAKEWEQLTRRQKSKYRHLDKAWFAPVYFLFSYFGKHGWLDGAAGFHFALMKGIYFYQIRLKILEAKQKGLFPESTTKIEDHT